MNTILHIVMAEYSGRMDYFFTHVLGCQSIRVALTELYDRKVFYKVWEGFGGMSKEERQDLLAEAGKFAKEMPDKIDLAKIMFVIGNELK